MTEILTVLGLIVALIILCVLIVKIIQHHGSKDVVRMFRSGNCIVAGHKGRGKDLLFQYVISAREKDGEIHAANIEYNKNTTVRAISDYELLSNNRKNFINGKYELEAKSFTPREDYYISDAGVALPAHSHSQLEKKYPTLPIVYALSRHLGEFNIHANAQEFGRIWDKLREQADYFFYCEKARVLFTKIAFIRFVMYDTLESAMAHRQPYIVKRSLLLRRASKEDLAQAHSFNARYGTVRRTWLWYKLPKYHYDTRAFYKLLYGHEPIDIDKINRARKKSKKEKKKK